MIRTGSQAHGRSDFTTNRGKMLLDKGRPWGGDGDVTVGRLLHGAMLVSVVCATLLSMDLSSTALGYCEGCPLAGVN